MTLDEFIKSMKQDLDAFRANWKEQQSEVPEHFPNDLDEGDWYDQFLTFESLNSGRLNSLD
jgi:hypothetical protein